METEIKLLTVRFIKKHNAECAEMTRQFVTYLKDLGVIAGTQVKIKKREVWKFTPQEAAVIQSVWYFRKKGFDLKKSIELARKSQQRRDLKRSEQNLFADLAP